jgi:hypothetical protein
MLGTVEGGGVKIESNSSPGSPAHSRDSSVERRPEEIEDLSKLLLPHWTKCFQKLAMDDSRKVRETVYLTHTQLCKNVGRNLAPFLKQLMPSWYLAQYDLYGPVGSAAKRSFQNVFPAEAKRTEVIKFCKNEILRAIIEHLQGPFRGRTPGDGSEGKPHKDKKKQQGGKKKGQQQEEPAVEVSSSEVAASSTSTNVGETSSSTGEAGHDGESYSMRVSYASLRALTTLIEQGLVEDEALEEIFGENGPFWSGAEYSNDISVINIFDI